MGLLASFAVLAEAWVVVPAATSPECVLRRAGTKWEGPCQARIEGDKMSLEISPAAAITSGTWRRGAAATSVWAGTVVVGDDQPDPVEIEIYTDSAGVLRTQLGWFAVSRFTSQNDVVRFDVDTSREVPPNEIDREIVQRADLILSTEAVWNKADDRRCPSGARTWSIYCAMEKATIDVSGAFHHRRPALQIVRAIVDERSANRGYRHRLMEYNNDATTRLEDVRSLFAEALARIDVQSRRSASPTAVP